VEKQGQHRSRSPVATSGGRNEEEQGSPLRPGAPRNRRSHQHTVPHRGSFASAPSPVVA